MARALLRRRPPAVVFEREKLSPRYGGDAASVIEAAVDALEKAQAELPTEMGIDQGRLMIQRDILDLTKMGSRLSISQIKGQGEESAKGIERRLVKVLDPHSGVARPLVLNTGSILNLLSERMLVILRVYVFPPETDVGKHYRRKREDLVNSIREKLEQRVHLSQWDDTSVRTSLGS